MTQHGTLAVLRVRDALFSSRLFFFTTADDTAEYDEADFVDDVDNDRSKGKEE